MKDSEFVNWLHGFVQIREDNLPPTEAESVAKEISNTKQKESD